jgi:GAF domain-containing protein
MPSSARVVVSPVRHREVESGIGLEELAREQAALRRVATLVAEAAPPGELFAAVATEVGSVVPEADVAFVGRYESGETLEFLGGWSRDGSHGVPAFVGQRVSLGGHNVSTLVFERNAPARVDHLEDDATPATALAREWARSAAGAPISVEGRLWGVMIVGSPRLEGLPRGIEDRLANFTDLIATAIANAQARDDLRRLAEEQTSLRKVATRVAEGASPDAIFSAVVDEVAEIMGLERIEMARYEPDGTATVIGASGDHPFPPGSHWELDGPSLLLQVRQTGRPARIDDYGSLPGTIATVAHEAGFRSAIGAPIILDGRTWGAIIAISTEPEPIPERSEARLVQFTDLVATAIANTQARDDLRRLAEEQASLRRLATLVAQGAAPDAIFAAVVDEVAEVMGVERIEMARYEPDGTATMIGASRDHPFPPGSRWVLDGPSLLLQVRETGRPARIDDYGSLPGTVAAVARNGGLRSGIGAPIIVDGGVWGAIFAMSTRPEPIPERSEARLAQVTDLVAIAVSKATSRTGLTVLADEQAALRRVATLVAQGAPPAGIFSAVAEEVGGLLGPDHAVMARFDGPDVISIMAEWQSTGEPPRLENRRSLSAGGIAKLVQDTGRTARVDDYESAARGRQSWVLDAGTRAAVAAPITVDGRLWGVMGVGSRGAPPSSDTEERLAAFTELVATAIANSQAREELRAIADEQAALRRVATLVAESAPGPVVFAAVAEEVGRLLHAERTFLARFDADDVTLVGAWPEREGPTALRLRGHLDKSGLAKPVRATNRPARVDRTDAAWAALPNVQELGLRSAVAAPISVQGRIWGMIEVAATSDEPVAPETEERLAGFAELVATAIANSQARDELSALADEQAALRRVATLVAGEPSPAVLFAAVTAEARRLFGAQQCGLLRYDEEGTTTVVGQTGMPGDAFIGMHIPLGGRNVTTLVFESGRPARLDSYPDGDPQAISVLGRSVGTQSAVGAPVSVAGRLWGVLILGSDRTEFFPTDTEERLVGFTELVATAIANSNARGELSALAEEQAALRRVATLVAEEAPAEAVFAAVCEEGARLFHAPCALERYDPGGVATILGLVATGDVPAIGTQVPLGGRNATSLVFETGRPARIDSFSADDSSPLTVMGRAVGQSAVGAPIHVGGRLWGVVAVNSERGERFAEDTEARLEGFADLVATAIANSQARGEARALTDEQAALRRVATLVAEEAAPEAVFAAISSEAAHLFDAECGLMRYDEEGNATIVAGTSSTPAFAIGTTFPIGGQNTTTLVHETGRPARMDTFADADSSPLTVMGRSVGRSAVGAPINVAGRLWGAAVVITRRHDPLPLDTEARLEGFAELAATAIANAEARTALTASRARVIATADETRRRIERDLHDGAQQRLVAIGLQLRAAQAAVPPELERLASELERVVAGLTAALEELREYVRGIHPAVLMKGGLGPALRALARRSTIPVDLVVRVEGRLAERIELGAYYVVSECLTNAAKHANASRVDIAVEEADGLLKLSVRDDGVGGARFVSGSGLVGLKDRVEALGGRLAVESPAGAGTTLHAEIPLGVPTPV